MANHQYMYVYVYVHFEFHSNECLAIENSREIGPFVIFLY